MLTEQKISKTTLDHLAFCPSSEVYQWATTLVIAPHPDDETLGCGGAIALLRQMGYRVHVMVLSDGYHSHPFGGINDRDAFRNSIRKDTIQALAELGVSNDSLTFLGLNDSLLPTENEAGFEEVVRMCRNKIADFKPDTILTPWRKDAHSDHRAAWHITKSALSLENLQDVNVVAYAHWALHGENELLWPSTAEVHPWRLDIKPVLEKKIKALSAYDTHQPKDISQHSIFETDVLSQFTHPWELYLDQQALRSYTSLGLG